MTHTAALSRGVGDPGRKVDCGNTAPCEAHGDLCFKIKSPSAGCFLQALDRMADGIHAEAKKRIRDECVPCREIREPVCNAPRIDALQRRVVSEYRFAKHHAIGVFV